MILAPISSGAMGDFVSYLSEQLCASTVFLCQGNDVSLDESVAVKRSPYAFKPRLIRVIAENIIPLQIFIILTTLFKSPRPGVVYIANSESRPWVLICIFILRYLFRIDVNLIVHDPRPHRGNIAEIIFYSFSLASRAISSRLIFLSEYNFYSYGQAGKSSFLPLRPSSYLIKLMQPSLVDSPLAPSEATSLLFFGRIEPYKGLLETVLLVKKLIRSTWFADRVSSSFIINIYGVGTHQYSQVLAAEINSLPFASNLLVRRHNVFMSNEEIAELIRSSSGILMPYTDYSNSCIPFFAKLFDKPVLCSEHPALVAHLLENGCINRPFGIHDPSSLCDALLWLSSL